jgi:hypothetical protein
MTIEKVRIHPAIGIARLGNSADAFFIGPERPGSVHAGPFKDEKGCIKRQAARFRLFGYDAEDRLVREITSDDATIEWTVELANHKAAYKRFDGLATSTKMRNDDIADRSLLSITPRPATLRGPDQAAKLDDGEFIGKKVPLGEARTDDRGRLLVLGGHGYSSSVPAARPLTTYANNERWHDDTSDGPITAKVTLKGQRSPVPVLPAWVICAPPDFAPAIQCVVTLYDTLLQVAIDRGQLPPLETPSFTTDVYPILARALAIRWVSSLAAPNHGTLAPAFGPGAEADMRAHIFGHLRDPALAPNEGGSGEMPMLWSEYYPGGQSFTVTPTQYEIMRRWSAGDFVDDWEGRPAEESAEITPWGLDRAALEACVGGAFFPGLEASWLLRDHYDFMEPFRLAHTFRAAGDVTKQMAVPWQADFQECELDEGYSWWPSHRPDDVFPDGEQQQVPWTRGLVETREDMVAQWHRLGFVVRKGTRHVETERG